MKKTTLLILSILILTGIELRSQSNRSFQDTIDYNSWHSSIMEMFENKTNYSKGAKREYGTALGVVYSVIQSFSVPQLNELFIKSNAKSRDWDRMFLLDVFIDSDPGFEITAILLYKHSKYNGVSFDGSNFYDLNYVPHFKIWKLDSKFEFWDNGYIVISEFDKNFKNTSNKILIGIPLDELDEKFLKIYNRSIFD